MADDRTANRRIKMTGRGIPLPGDNIDTDRIIPARYLKSVTFDDLGEHAFQDERFDDKGNSREHPLNDPRFRDGEILIVNRNFGCGSSREHAPQALLRAGIRALIGESFAEIFAGNCTALGIPAVWMERELVLKLMERVTRRPETRIDIDLEGLTVSAQGEIFPISLPDTFRLALMDGSWDTTAILLSGEAEIRKKAAALPYLNEYP